MKLDDKTPAPPKKNEKKIKFKTIFECMFCDFPVSCFFQFDVLGVIFYNFLYPSIIFQEKKD